VVVENYSKASEKALKSFQIDFRKELINAFVKRESQEKVHQSAVT